MDLSVLARELKTHREMVGMELRTEALEQYQEAELYVKTAGDTPDFKTVLFGDRKLLYLVGDAWPQVACALEDGEIAEARLIAGSVPKHYNGCMSRQEAMRLLEQVFADAGLAIHSKERSLGDILASTSPTFDSGLYVFVSGDKYRAWAEVDIWRPELKGNARHASQNLSPANYQKYLAELKAAGLIKTQRIVSPLFVYTQEMQETAKAAMARFVELTTPAYAPNPEIFSRFFCKHP